jgi:hypothetical protein
MQGLSELSQACHAGRVATHGYCVLRQAEAEHDRLHNVAGLDLALAPCTQQQRCAGGIPVAMVHCLPWRPEIRLAACDHPHLVEATPADTRPSHGAALLAATVWASLLSYLGNLGS